MRSGERWAVKAFCSGHIQIGFVDRSHLDLRSELLEYSSGLFGVFTVTVRLSGKKDCLWAHLVGRVHAEFARSVAGSANDAALIVFATDNDRLALERWVEYLFHADEEGVHIDMGDGAKMSGCVHKENLPQRDRGDRDSQRISGLRT